MAMWPMGQLCSADDLEHGSSTQALQGQLAASTLERSSERGYSAGLYTHATNASMCSILGDPLCRLVVALAMAAPAAAAH